MDAREKTRFAIFTTLAPGGIFCGALAVLSVVRTVDLSRAAAYGAIGLICTGGAILMRPRLGRAGAMRHVLVQLGILVGAAVAAVLVLASSRDFVLGGAVYLAGWAVETIVGIRLGRNVMRPNSP
jgi:hypothetical protein